MIGAELRSLIVVRNPSLSSAERLTTILYGRRQTQSDSQLIESRKSDLVTDIQVTQSPILNHGVLLISNACKYLVATRGARPITLNIEVIKVVAFSLIYIRKFVRWFGKRSKAFYELCYEKARRPRQRLMGDDVGTFASAY